jgi:hypothetical protein
MYAIFLLVYHRICRVNTTVARFETQHKCTDVRREQKKTVDVKINV